MRFKAGTVVVGFMLGLLVVWLLGVHFVENFYQDASLVSQEECTVSKPSGTTCVYEGSWVAKEVE